MAVDYLHGVESIDVDSASTSVTTVKTAIIALIGIAPAGPVNPSAPTVCISKTDDAQFGAVLPGFNIPKALEIIRAIAGNTPVLVVNTFNAATNTANVAMEVQTVEDGKFKLAFPPVGTVTLADSEGDPIEFTENVDYQLDAYGNFTVLSSAIPDGTIFKASYKKLDAATVLPAQIIGGTDASDVRTGLDIFDVAYNTYGYTPKVLIAPYYVETAGVATALRTKAAKYRAIYLQDAPVGTTFAQALAGRGVAGAINFNTSDGRAYLLYPYLKSFDAYTNADQVFPYSAFMAGLIAYNDAQYGFWESPSNKEIANVTGVERAITWSLNDAGTQANQLNAAGITTIANGYATGYRAWGNRSAAFPSITGAKSFVIYTRINDIVSESLELAALPYVDKGITQALIDLVLAAGNAYMKVLIGRGAVLSGSRVVYNKDDNTAEELANGHIVFEKIYMIPTPAERITFKNVLDISLLDSLK